jgi:hypothetical protein
LPDVERGREGEMLDLKLEVVVIPVSDVDRAERLYGSPGWRLDAVPLHMEAARP